MSRGKSITRWEDIIAASSSRSDVDDHESLGADQEQALEAHTSTHDEGLSSVMPQHQGDLFIQDPFTRKYEARERTTFQYKFVLLS
jgi:hypothetical protein